jgi:two-component system KDP operon response regulator KdpE
MSSSPEKVLIVAEDAAQRFSIRKSLEQLNLDCGEASSAEIAIMRLRMIDYDAVLLVLPISESDGIATCQRLLAANPRLPVLILSKIDCLNDRIEVLEAGAADYIFEPFAIRELAARLRSAARRYRAPFAAIAERFVVGNIVLDLAKHRVEKSGCEVSLAPTEFRTLQVLMEQAGRPVAHSVLLSSIWGDEYVQSRQHLRVVVRALRKKIEDDPSRPSYLLTHNYFGYRFRDQ